MSYHVGRTRQGANALFSARLFIQLEDFSTWEVAYNVDQRHVSTSQSSVGGEKKHIIDPYLILINEEIPFVILIALRSSLTSLLRVFGTPAINNDAIARTLELKKRKKKST